MSSIYHDHNNLAPANGWYIFATLIGALLLNMLPLQEVILPLRPDFVALTIVYWNVHQPHRVGMSIAFGMGLLVDVSNAGVLGQHALAYSIISYLSLIFHRRLLYFNPIQQAPQIGLILVIMQMIILIVGLLGGYRFLGLYYFIGSITGMLMWPIITYVLGILRRPKTESETL